MVVLLVHPAAQAQHDQHVRQHQQMEPDCGDRGLDDDLAEVTDEQIDRIDEKQALDRIVVLFNGVEDGGHVHQQLGEHGPQVLNVPKEHKQRRQDQPHADVEQYQQGDGVQQENQLPGEGDAVQHTEHKEHAQGQAEIN